jgi:predicted enzyme related to lactoylglutathione lyase
VIDVDDVMRSYEELHERGVEFEDLPKREPWGGWATFADSEGNRFGLHDNHGPQPQRDPNAVSKMLGM